MVLAQTRFLEGVGRVKAPMSALGQKQTFALLQPMSALPQKADIRSSLAHVGYGPEAAPYVDGLRSTW
jgi:hypothetical protein